MILNLSNDFRKYLLNSISKFNKGPKLFNYSNSFKYEYLRCVSSTRKTSYYWLLLLLSVS